MKTKQLMVPAVLCLPLLGGCAQVQSTDNKVVESPPRITGATDQPEPLYQIGRYYQGQNRHAQAIAAYTQALQADSRFHKARNGLGVVFSLQGRYDEAIQAFESAIHEAPDDAYIYSNLGYAYYLKGHDDAQAIAALERAISLDPGNARARNNLGRAYARMKKRADPVKILAGAGELQGRGTPSAQAQKGSRNDMATLATHQPETSSVQEVQLTQPVPAVIVERVKTTVPVATSRVELVQSGLNVFELKERTEALPVQHAIAHSMVAAPILPATVTARIEVSNGNGVTGMAKVVGDFLRNQGFKASRLTNQKLYKRDVTQVEYRAGFLAEAERLRASLPAGANLVESKDLRKDISVRLVLGRDIVRSMSHFDANSRKTLLVRSWQLS